MWAKSTFNKTDVYILNQQNLKYEIYVHSDKVELIVTDTEMFSRKYFCFNRKKVVYIEDAVKIVDSVPKLNLPDDITKIMLQAVTK